MLTEQNKLDISYLYLEKGLNRDDIARELRLTKWNVKIFLTKNNLKIEKNQRIKDGLLPKKYNPLINYKKQAYKLTQDDKDKITELYKNKVSCVNIHKNLNIPEGIVYTFIKETLGIRSQNQINSDKAYKLNEVEKERIKSIYFASSSINASKELNIPKHVVFEYIKANNLYKEKLIYKKEKLKPIVLKMYLEDKMSLLEISRTKIACQRIIKDIVKELDITRTFKECMTNLQLKKGYTLKNNDFFNVIDNELKAYWLGFIYADGSINKKITVLSISLKSTDTLHLEKFANLFNKKVFIYKRKAYINLPERTCCSLRISNTFIANDLNNKGIVPRKTYVDSNVIFKHIPNDLVRHFIRGYFDGDGCVTSNNAISFVCNSSLFLQGIKKFLNKVTNKDRKLKQVKDKTFFLLTYTGLDSKKNIFDYFYKDSTVFLERKKNKFNLD